MCAGLSYYCVPDRDGEEYVPTSLYCKMIVLNTFQVDIIGPITHCKRSRLKKFKSMKMTPMEFEIEENGAGIF
jgi:hypothetical protein